MTIPRGAQRQTFTITTQLAGKRRTVTLSATYRKRTVRRKLTVGASACPYGLRVASVSSAVIAAGGSAALKVALNCAVGVDTRLRLTSSTANVRVPSTVVVRAGALTATVTATSRVPASGHTGGTTVVRAELGGVGATGWIDVLPGLRSIDLALDRDSVAVRLSVVLTGRVFADTPVTVRLTEGARSFDLNVVVYNGQDRRTISLGTEHPTAWTAVATLGGTKRAELAVGQMYQPGDPVTVEASFAPAASGTVTARVALVLSHPAPFAMTAEVVIDNKRVTIPFAQGIRMGMVTLTLSAYPAQSHLSASVLIDLGQFQPEPVETTVLVVPWVTSVSAPAVVVDGQPESGTVRLFAASPVDQVVALTGVGVDVPPTVTVPAGAASATFPIMAHQAGEGAVRADLRGRSVTSSTFTVGRAIPAACDPVGIVAPDGLYRGNDSLAPIAYDAEIRLGCVASSEMVIPLWAEKDAVSWITVPAFVRVPAGSSTGTFAIATIGGGSCYYSRCQPGTVETIRAGLRERSFAATVEVKPGVWAAMTETNAETGFKDLVVWMTGRTAPGTTARIVSDAPQYLDFPAEVSIGEEWAGFKVTASSGVPLPAGVTVTVTVTIGRTTSTVTVQGPTSP